MGIFTDGGNEHIQNAANDTNVSKSGTGVEKENGYPTDVNDVYADDVIKKGMEEFPVFNVSPGEFFDNMSSDRKKIRFKNGSKVTTYKNKTKNSHRNFYIRTIDNAGKTYVRRIK